MKNLKRVMNELANHSEMHFIIWSFTHQFDEISQLLSAQKVFTVLADGTVRIAAWEDAEFYIDFCGSKWSDAHWDCLNAILHLPLDLNTEKILTAGDKASMQLGRCHISFSADGITIAFNLRKI